jgi:hypothetical protein
MNKIIYKVKLMFGIFENKKKLLKKINTTDYNELISFIENIKVWLQKEEDARVVINKINALEINFFTLFQKQKQSMNLAESIKTNIKTIKILKTSYGNTGLSMVDLAINVNQLTDDQIMEEVDKGHYNFEFQKFLESIIEKLYQETKQQLEQYYFNIPLDENLIEDIKVNNFTEDNVIKKKLHIIFQDKVINEPSAEAMAVSIKLYLIFKIIPFTNEAAKKILYSNKIKDASVLKVIISRITPNDCFRYFKQVEIIEFFEIIKQNFINPESNLIEDELLKLAFLANPLSDEDIVNHKDFINKIINKHWNNDDVLYTIININNIESILSNIEIREIMTNIRNIEHNKTISNKLDYQEEELQKVNEKYEKRLNDITKVQEEQLKEQNKKIDTLKLDTIRAAATANSASNIAKEAYINSK